MKDDPDIIKDLFGFLDRTHKKPSPSDSVEESIRKMKAMMKERK